MSAGYSTTIRNDQLAVLNTDIGTSAKLRTYSGTRPATGGTATTLLVENICNAAAFGGTPSAATLTANAVASGTAVATGTASWSRILQSNGTTICVDLGVATSGQEVTIANTSIVTSATVAISSIVITRGNA